jgi:hypothetical protein
MFSEYNLTTIYLMHNGKQYGTQRLFFPTKISNYKQEQSFLYPTMVHAGGFVTTSALLKDARTQIIDALGKIIVELEVSSSLSIQIPNFIPQGIYYARATSFKGQNNLGAIIVK